MVAAVKSPSPVSGGAPHKRRFGLFTTLGLLVMIAYIATNVVIIYRTPKDGESTPAALASAFEAAMRTNSADGAERLIANLPEDDSVVVTLLEAARCDGDATRAAVEGASSGVEYIVLSKGSGQCGRLPIAEHDGRWMIDLWAAPLA